MNSNAMVLAREVAAPDPGFQPKQGATPGRVDSHREPSPPDRVTQAWKLRRQ